MRNVIRKLLESDVLDQAHQFHQEFIKNLPEGQEAHPATQTDRKQGNPFAGVWLVTRNSKTKAVSGMFNAWVQHQPEHGGAPQAVINKVYSGKSLNAPGEPTYHEPGLMTDITNRWLSGVKKLGVKSVTIRGDISKARGRSASWYSQFPNHHPDLTFHGINDGTND